MTRLKRGLAAARAWFLKRRHTAGASTGSLTRRMISIAALWISVLLVGGGFALDRVLSEAITRNFDAQLEYVLTAMIGSAEIGPDGEVRFNRPLGDQRFLEPYSGLYWQVSAPTHEPFRSRSLWDRALRQGEKHDGQTLHVADSDEFGGEPLRILDREIRLPGSPVEWRFQVAASRAGLNEQIAVLRRTLVRSFAILGLGLIILAALQATYGLWPLRSLRRAVAKVSAGTSSRIEAQFPNEVRPLVEELNDLLTHNERQAEEARRHAGNLAHALKTPLTVLMNEATAGGPELAETVIRSTTTMRRQVDHHLARARAVGRRANAQARSEVWPSLKAVERAMSRMHRHVTVDLAGDQKATVHVERQDLDEILGNLIENAAKYGQGRVFVTVVREIADFPANRKPNVVEILIEDDGPGIPEAERGKLFERGARLDTGKPGTGLGLAIVRDVIGIYGGTITLEESEDLGGLQVRLRLPAAA
ncbi:ATP-binding protein [Rhizorhabdus dicambivorans]|uniref:histidine kinase n=1 Tax=Rhizorhabdus dicambivorans TaxID=1850238 RepID=A0A2A4G1A0_9SPHN|nr:histidine kinase [Rhizorhabdus dicambivorans]PCE43771.1 histidine kinase [Rhizorhabdus dicambivorans]